MTWITKPFKWVLDQLVTRTWVLLYNLVALAVIIGVALAYFQWHDVRDIFPDEMPRLALGAIWFGSLGGISISIKGVNDHRSDWSESWVLWHMDRPFTAAIAGGMTYLFLLVVNSGNENFLSTAVVLTAAFIAGLQENRFFGLVEDVGAHIFASPHADDAKKKLGIAEVFPKRASPGTQVKVIGQGFRAKDKFRIGPTEITPDDISTDGNTMTVTIPQAVVPASDPYEVQVVSEDHVAYVKANALTVEPPKAIPPAASTVAPAGGTPPAGGASPT